MNNYDRHAARVLSCRTARIDTLRLVRNRALYMDHLHEQMDNKQVSSLDLMRERTKAPIHRDTQNLP